MLKALINAMRVKELRRKILFTLAIIALYRVGSFIPVPGIPFAALVENFSASSGNANAALVMLNLFSGGALEYFSVFSLGIMPYITASIIMQLMQGVIPALGRWQKEGEIGQRKITRITRYLTLGLGLINAIGYLVLFQSSTFGIKFNDTVLPLWVTYVVIVVTLLAGTAFIMWMGELITQRGIGNGMSLIIFANIVARLPGNLYESITNAQDPMQGVVTTVIVILVILIIIPAIVFIERGQRRIPVQYSKRVVGRRVMGGQSTYLPFKVNGAGVIPIIFASCLLYLPAQIAAFFTDVDWLNAVSNFCSSGWGNWLLTFIFIIFFAYFYTSMVYHPEDTADNLRNNGGFIPGVRPGGATVQYLKDVINRITLPGAIFLAAIAIIPSILYTVSGNPLINTFGGTSVLIMVGVALDTMTKLESQLKMHNYDGFFK
ncbi:MAG: preprotein translocase subunit SecY [Coriobacteriales bacterium]|nr:preprotein translocase subunit SecY [Coriobacteriales bacterium]